MTATTKREPHEERVLAAIERAEEEGAEWKHGCDAICQNVTLWIKRCPHCGMPASVFPSQEESAEGSTR